MKAFLEKLQEKFTEVLVLLLLAVLTWVWALCGDMAAKIFGTPLGGRVALGTIFALVVVAAYGWLRWWREKNGKPDVDRLVPVPGAGYFLDPKNGEACCPRCKKDGDVIPMLELSQGWQCNACGKLMTKKI